MVTDNKLILPVHLEHLLSNMNNKEINIGARAAYRNRLEQYRDILDLEISKFDKEYNDTVWIPKKLDKKNKKV